MSEDELIIYTFNLSNKVEQHIKVIDELIKVVYTDIYNKGIEFACSEMAKQTLEHITNLKHNLETLQNTLDYKNRFKYEDIQEFLSYLGSKDISKYKK